MRRANQIFKSTEVVRAFVSVTVRSDELGGLISRHDWHAWGPLSVLSPAARAGGRPAKAAKVTTKRCDDVPIHLHPRVVAGC